MKIKPQRKSPQGVPAPERPCPGMFHALKKGGVCVGVQCFLIAEAGEDRVSFPHSSFFKTFFIYLFIFYKIPFQFPLLPLQYRSCSPSGGVGVGSGVGVLVQESAGRGGGERFEHHESPAGAAGGRAETDGPSPDIYTGAQGGPRTGPPKEAGGMAWGCRRSGFPKKEKNKNE